MKTVVFTGKVELLGTHITRNELIQLVTVMGWRVKSSVSSAVDLVVCSSQDFLDRKGTKLAAADRLGIKTITVPELLKLAGIPVEPEKVAAPDEVLL